MIMESAYLTSANTPAPSAHDYQVAASTVAVSDLVVSTLDEDKAEDIVVFDLEGRSSVADHIIIASGRSQRHVAALADRLLRRMREEGHGKARVEGLPGADWVLIDCGDVVVHLFRPEVRQFYNLERIWAPDSAHRGAA
jgi:ribosome-associated protein